MNETILKSKNIKGEAFREYSHLNFVLDFKIVGSNNVVSPV